MAHKNLVGGTAYDTKGGRCLVGGTGYSIKKGRTLVGGTGYDVNFSSYDPVFANNDWAAIIEACQTGNVPESWTVGSQKVMSFGAAGNYTIDIIGRNHDTYADGSGTAPLTLQMHKAYHATYAMNYSGGTTGGWDSCDMRTGYLPTLLNLMPAEVKSGIKAVSKKTSSGRRSTTLTTSSDKLFLLSEIEVYGSKSYSVAGEGSQYAYYSAGNDKVKYTRDDVPANWWSRSPSSKDNNSFCIFSSNGTVSTTYSTSSYYMAPAFCF